ncbi:MAG: PHP domain-containing protein [Firmicutes bacterium]|nr:PHP domain-containing protein [Bacillota bacterium]
MVNMHNHTRHSDGSYSTREVLEIMERQGFEVISITDHNSVDAYKDLLDSKVRSAFSGKIVVGTEFYAQIEGFCVEFLFYDFDLKQANRHFWEGSFQCYKDILEFYEFLKKRTRQKLASFGVVINKTSLNDIRNEIADRADEITQKMGYKFNAEDDIWKDHILNPDSPLAIDFSKVLMDGFELIELMRGIGAKVILAHPARIIKKDWYIIDKVKNLIDGIECYHSEHTEEYAKKLVEYCRTHELIVVGGSDFHEDREKLEFYGRDKLTGEDVLKNFKKLV